MGFCFSSCRALIGGFIGKERMAREARKATSGHAELLEQGSGHRGIAGRSSRRCGGIYRGILGDSHSATAIASVAVAGAGLIGLTIGGSWGKRREEREYALAIERQGEGQPGPMQSLVRDIVQEVEPAHAPSRHFAAQVEAERLRSASRQNRDNLTLIVEN